jgi:hypothetical protein
MDFVDVVLDPAAEGQPLAIEFHPAPGADAKFNTTAYNRLGLIITRFDANEDSDPAGEYTILLPPAVDGGR